MGVCKLCLDFVVQTFFISISADIRKLILAVLRHLTLI